MHRPATRLHGASGSGWPSIIGGVPWTGSMQFPDSAFDETSRAWRIAAALFHDQWLRALAHLDAPAADRSEICSLDLLAGSRSGAIGPDRGVEVGLRTARVTTQLLWIPVRRPKWKRLRIPRRAVTGALSGAPAGRIGPRTRKGQGASRTRSAGGGPARVESSHSQSG